MKYCVAVGILNVDDGSEEGFAKDDTSEVLYENTGASRYFMKNFTQDIMGYTSAKEFEKEEWIDVNEDKRNRAQAESIPKASDVDGNV